jgi:hypothetical protein
MAIREAGGLEPVLNTFLGVCQFATSEPADLSVA